MDSPSCGVEAIVKVVNDVTVISDPPAGPWNKPLRNTNNRDRDWETKT